MEIEGGRHWRNGIPPRCDCTHVVGCGQDRKLRFGGGTAGSTKCSTHVCTCGFWRNVRKDPTTPGTHSIGGREDFFAETPVSSAESVSREFPREQAHAAEGSSSASTGSPSPAVTQQHFLPAPRSGGQPQQHPDFSPPPRIPCSVDAVPNGERRSARTIAPPATAATKEKLAPVSRVWKSTVLVPGPYFPNAAHGNAGESNC
jgi:hypothetical protein